MLAQEFEWCSLMDNYCHSVHLVESKCKGCVNCIKRCPTEAIRVREGKAHIIEERCIDCGECVRNCPNEAKAVLSDHMAQLGEFDYTVALPAPALYGQFPEGTPPREVLAALLTIGFDHADDVAFGADLVAMRIRESLAASRSVRPMISSACPSVVRLIQVRFPNLVGNLIPVISPMRAAATIARYEVSRMTDIPDERVGVFFITPCPGKISAVNAPAMYEDLVISGAIPIAEVYPLILDKLRHSPDEINSVIDRLHPGSGLGLGWARSGGEVQSIGEDRQIAVDGIHSVIDILEDVERGKLSDIDYIEAQACVGGCVGGVLTVENPFITRRRIRILAAEYADTVKEVESSPLAREVMAYEDWFKHDKPIEPRPALKLDDDMAVAIRKMDQMKRILDDLPGLDCGSCGAPNCQALAEDVVRDLATEMDCMFKLRERVRELAGEMMGLAEKVPPAMGHGDRKIVTSQSEGTEENDVVERSGGESEPGSGESAGK